MRKHDSVATLCSAASSGCNAWAQLETLGDDQKPFSLDRAFHAGVVLYGKDRGVDAQGVAYDELGANIPTNGRVVVFGGVRSTRCRAQVEGSGGGSLFVTRAPPGGGRKVGTGGGWGRGCGRGVRVGRRLLLWWRVRRMDVLGGGTMVVVSSLSLPLSNPLIPSPSPPRIFLRCHRCCPSFPCCFCGPCFPGRPGRVLCRRSSVTLVGFPQRWTREGT